MKTQEKILSQINTNTYENVRDVSILAPIIVQYSNLLIHNQTITFVSPIFIPIECLGLYLTYSKNIQNTKNIKEIKNLYQEFLNNYNKLNTVFELKTPLEIYALYTYLLDNGYLSQNKEIEFGDKNSRDISIISGANVFTGQSVCRHRSKLLADILNNYQIDSYSIGCYAKNYDINFKDEITEIDYETYSKTPIIANYETHEFKYPYYDKIQNAYFLKHFKIEKNEIKEKDIFKFFLGNHEICLSKQNGKNYFLDPTQSRIYRLSIFDQKILQDKQGDIIIKQILSDKNTKKAIKTLKAENNISQDEEIETLNKINNLSYENIDIFEKFYNQNKELYEEISNEIIKIKKKRFLL